MGDMDMMQYQRGPNYTAGTGRIASDSSLALAQEIADTEETPVGIWVRDGWLAVSDVAPGDDDDDTREAEGWALVAVVDPWSAAW